MFNISEFKLTIENILKTDYGKLLDESKNYEKYNALSKVIMGKIVDNWEETKKSYLKGKQACYFSAEFLMGRALGNNLMNLGIYDEVKEVLKELNININDIEEVEEDAGLGNGGLGRLAACFMESAATKNLPVTGYGIRYSYGLFKQRFMDGFQIEEVDNWLKYGDPWSCRRDEDTIIIEFSNEKVKAVPYDTPIIGYGTKNINKLRLFKAEPIKEFDFNLFNEQEYDKAVEDKNRAEDISRVLYPNDSTEKGKILRLKQQYFFVSAGLKDIIRAFKKIHGDKFEVFSDYYAIQLNDTHPVVAIAELMRILVDEEGLTWTKAWKVVVNTFAYTNHTILREALEEWDVKLYKKLLPRIYGIIKKIDQEFVKELKKKKYTDKKINSMRIICDDKIRMAFLAIHGTHATNGVAKLHTNILKHQELKDWYELYPNRFLNKTNGITPRRWLALCNRQLSNLITELLGNTNWVLHLDDLKALEKYINNEEILNRILDIKTEKKKELAEYIKIKEGIDIDPNSLFDIQIKRLHEYKRQLLNAFGILDLYFKLKENPKLTIVPRTFIFGAKAAPGYIRAKAIIKFINEIAKLINNDSEIQGKIKVVFVQNYRVSYAEKLFPAADISEQISTAGKEASGTGNMKFMLNGTPTLGTYDGANVEIVQEAGEENNFIFGARVEELEKIKDSYNPKEYYNKDKNLRRVVDTLIDGTFHDGDTGIFKELYESLLEGASWHKADNYFIFRDFNDYIQARDNVDRAYRNKMKWAKKCLMNIANAGKFSSDRTIEEYAKEIWKIKFHSI
ncbi:glycogen/starch/alpha-glucan phosphorylase [Clostridium botulinum C]|uniref:Alpha-1,4 glucan phosphorylase n=2 Tax=Clostridium botulinum TaxID=1491 RepID=A0A9Q4TKG8_CLOBO|nr:glycogen/starch/alpha-glucan phosphorylase [Clostridium botulinum]MCD3195081.1 glycogen/starch/alpha-glucan phosphorylase [Clostridium botulinum C]MCD3200421.1 glycogen/starch/alpha-glucan phosphorylase [Clostridium botulinum C]MCD3205839.1 glycogen/starch/alpha-glucan phosphorylase [Clostridium botulinum C]MCD3208256.1 glycogen/starch/alpha-glucan phosphorylase [Clostridium botulinum C]MCD3224126.1 glycogen/starch/alpha-glucan phosphorylase [Clostridium botulinum C]